MKVLILARISVIIVTIQCTASALDCNVHAAMKKDQPLDWPFFIYIFLSSLTLINVIYKLSQCFAVVILFRSADIIVRICPSVYIVEGAISFC